MSTSVSSTSSSSSSSSTSSTSSTSYDDFDVEALIEAKVAVKQERIDTLQAEVDENETTISAYSDLQDLLLAVQDTLQLLRSEPGYSNADEDVFKARSAYLTSSSSSITASDVMSVTVDAGTTLGTHSVVVQQIATTNILGSETFTSSSDELSLTGTITLGVSGGTTADISITSGMSLADIVDAINAETDTTGVVASVMEVSDSEYMLVLTTSDTGATITASDSSGTLLADTFGILDSNGDIDSDHVLQASQNAILVVDGVTCTRSSNEIDDLLDGCTITLYGSTKTSDDTATTATYATLTLEIENDLTSILEDIEYFVVAYNSLRDFIETNQATNDDGEAADDAVLYGDYILRTISQTLQSWLSSVDLESIGISISSDNYLSVDEDTLESAITDDLATIQEMFSYYVTTSSSSLSILSHDDGPSSASFSLTVTVDSDGAITGVTCTDDDNTDSSALFTYDADTNVITGVDGTDYEGLSFVYTGTTSRTVDVTISQGIADAMYYAIDTVANETDGSLETEMEALDDTNTMLEQRIDSLEYSLETYEEYLYTLYSSYASQIAEAQTTLDLLEALLNASSD